jgi:hypothetical protein
VGTFFAPTFVVLNRVGNLACPPYEDCHRYRELFAEVLSTEDLHGIRRATHYCQPLGGDRLKAQIELKTGQTFGRMGRGRPRRVDQK